MPDIQIMRFGRAADLRDQLNELLARHGDDVRVAFSLSDDEATAINDATIGPIKIDGIELTTPPRIDLCFEHR